MKSKFQKFLFHFAGLAAAGWFLIRVIPKPSRAAYPCQRAAFPMASAFIIYLIGLAGIWPFLKKYLKNYNGSNFWKYGIMISFVALCSLSFLLWPGGMGFTETINQQEVFIPTDNPNTPVGEARGIAPGRVVWNYNPDATSWNGVSGKWWDASSTSQAEVDTMLSESLQWLTNENNDSSAWDELFRYFNEKHKQTNKGYSPGEKIAIKINMNNYSGGTLDNRSNTTPQLVLSLIRQLVNVAGVPDSLITVYDKSKYIPLEIFNPCTAEFPNLQFMDDAGKSGKSNWKKYVVDYSDSVRWSEKLVLEKQGGNPTFLPTMVSQANYIINLSNLKGHDLAGVSLCAKNHFGTFYAYSAAFNYYGPKAAGVHPYIAPHNFGTCGGTGSWDMCGRAMGTYNALVDLMGHKDLGEKTLLFMLDALYCPKQHTTNPVKWAMAPFNNDWTSSLILSQDGVAIESVGLDFLRSEPNVQTNVYGNVDNYLHEASQAHNPPSGTFYDPEGDGSRLTSLGVHEHWNNATEKKYSRNLGTASGIELVHSSPLTPAAAVESNLTSGSYTQSQEIVLSCATPNSIIYYTLDGSVPTLQSSKYSGPVTLNKSCILKAFAVARHFTPSPYLEINFVLTSTEIYTNGNKQDVKIFPNPCQGSFHVQFPDGKNPRFYKILDASGKLQMQQTLEIPAGRILSVDVKNMAPGAYWFWLEGCSKKQIQIIR